MQPAYNGWVTWVSQIVTNFGAEVPACNWPIYKRSSSRILSNCWCFFLILQPAFADGMCTKRMSDPHGLDEEPSNMEGLQIWLGTDFWFLLQDVLIRFQWLDRDLLWQRCCHALASSWWYWIFLIHLTPLAPSKNPADVAVAWSSRLRWHCKVISSISFQRDSFLNLSCDANKVHHRFHIMCTVLSYGKYSHGEWLVNVKVRFC